MTIMDHNPPVTQMELCGSQGQAGGEREARGAVLTGTGAADGRGRCLQGEQRAPTGDRGDTEGARCCPAPLAVETGVLIGVI